MTRRRRRRRRRRSRRIPLRACSAAAARSRRRRRRARRRRPRARPPPPQKQGRGSMFNLDPFGTAGGGSYVPAGMSKAEYDRIQKEGEAKKLANRKEREHCASATQIRQEGCEASRLLVSSRRSAYGANRSSSRSRATRRRSSSPRWALPSSRTPSTQIQESLDK